MKTVAIVQARMGSTRLPGKVMKPINGVPMIDLLLARLAHSERIDQIVVATSMNLNNEPLLRHVESLGYSAVAGSELDVLDRYVQAARKFGADVIVRITGDCPLVDPTLVDQVVAGFNNESLDYLSNIDPPSFPDGLDVEVFTMTALDRASRETSDTYDREHVTPYLRRKDIFRTSNYMNQRNLSGLRWTVDEPADLEVVTKIFDHFAPNVQFSWQEVMDLHDAQPSLFEANRDIQRNEGANMGTGQKLWKRAKHIIPGGNMLLSKRAEMFLPDQWPAYFSKASGCRVWDMDGHEYIDMSLMGIGTNTLGYGHPEVDAAVRDVIDKGNLTTLNAPEEVYLAERLIALHPWAEMARFTRTGGEGNAVAIRIARAASGKDKVAICGYHGWHDWYLAANLGDSTHLASHLLPGLQPNGVPKVLKGTTLAFGYNDIEALQNILQDPEVGVIKMEVSRNAPPQDGFLQKIRQIATEKGIVLIFDECTSGFRQTFGGLHKLYDVEPDMAIFSKTMGNGYAVTAVIGRRDVMEAAQSTFISSTFWTERIGSVAALKTLEVMERVRSWEQITAIGLRMRKGWQDLADKYGLLISHWGIPALAGYSFKGPNALKYKTLITQEMLAQGILATTSCYACIAHTDDVIEQYFNALDQVFELIWECENGRNIDELLHGPVCHAGFKRLN